MAEKVALQLGRRVKALRKKQDLTQEELAARSKVSLKHLQKIEGKNPYNASLVTLEKLSKGLGIPMWKLVKFDD